MCVGICFNDYHGQCSLYIWQKDFVVDSPDIMKGIGEFQAFPLSATVVKRTHLV